ncbi:MAG TPA: hypothetical protein PLP17_13105 [Oligoflexia bacterium]|nr:hypothetical protein [Oligoflexia bacterium]
MKIAKSLLFVALSFFLGIYDPSGVVLAEDNNVDVDGFFDKGKVSEGMVGGSFAERREPKTKPAAVDRSIYQRHMQQELNQNKKGQNKGRQAKQRTNTSAVTPQIDASSGASAPDLGISSSNQAPPPVQQNSADTAEVENWSRQMKDQLENIQQQGKKSGNPSNQYYDQILKRLDAAGTPDSGEEKKKDDESTRF